MAKKKTKSQSLVLGKIFDEVVLLLENIQKGKLNKEHMINFLQQETYSFDHLNTFHSKQNLS
ncbi:hypothetical protein [Lunatibacter salilacus]|uniref:hypothetical protein n=1 Tax=Lunatibacter salilacus TaxID=2483804 RepID=UPI00131C9FF5|nr:hypothetical protein [Lunatibacter salilacus]